MSKKITRPPRGIQETLGQITRKSLLASDNVTFTETLERFPDLDTDQFLEKLSQHTIAITKQKQNSPIIQVWSSLYEEGYHWLCMPDVLLLVARLQRHGHLS